MTEKVLYGLAKGETNRCYEDVLLTNATDERIELVKVLAKKDGYHSFRVATIELGTKLNFGDVVK